jgi:Flp pilus assembly protein protease CpaA
MYENIASFALQTPQQIIGTILTILIGAVLFHASIQDIHRRDIGSMHVIVLYILIAFYSIITGNMGIQTTYVFLFAFILFIGISVLSFGHFGIGDSLVIGALAWYLGSFSNLQSFLYAIGIIAVPWAMYWFIRYHKDNSLRGIVSGFKRILPIDKVRVGDVLYGDNFMHGLQTKDIEKLRQDGYVTITVKSPMPFIPVIFTAFVLILFL